MATSQSVVNDHVRSVPWRGSLLILAPIAGIWMVSSYLTVPLETPSSPTAPPPARAQVDSVLVSPTELPPWPSHRLEGDEAKTYLLNMLIAVDERLDQVSTYTATFRKTERINGVIGPEQTLAMKFRQNPFAVYFKYLDPTPGKEVVYAEGHYENKLIAHSTGVSRWLVPRLAVPPNHPIALAESRHPITEAGLGNLTKKLIEFRRIDLEDKEAVAVLDKVTDAHGKTWFRSFHQHFHKSPTRPFAQIEVFYDVVSHIPLKITNYDWPEPGGDGQPVLAERYIYEDLMLDASLSALDFDPANPAYTFHRY